MLRAEDGGKSKSQPVIGWIPAYHRRARKRADFRRVINGEIT